MAAWLRSAYSGGGWKHARDHIRGNQPSKQHVIPAGRRSLGNLRFGVSFVAMEVIAVVDFRTGDGDG